MLENNHIEEKKINLTAWKNDIVNFALELEAKEATLSDINIIFEDLKKADNSNTILSKQNFAASFTKTTKAYIGRGGNWNNAEFKVDAHDILSKNFPFTINHSSSGSLWIEINIPQKAIEGIYGGQIHIQSNAFTFLTINISLEILDIVYPEADSGRSKHSFGFELWHYPYFVSRYYKIEEKELFGTKHLNILRDHLIKYSEAGGDTITTTICEDPWSSQTYDKYPSMIKWTHDGKVFSFDYSHFDKYVELALKLGIDQKIKCFSLLPWRNRLMYTKKNKKTKTITLIPGSKQWVKCWSYFLKDFIRHLEQKGWFDLVYIAIDERPIFEILSAIKLIKTHKNSEGKTLKISSALNYSSTNKNILNHIDDISIALEHIELTGDNLRNLADSRRESGLRTTMYTCVGHYPNSFALSEPKESTWTMFYAFSQNLDGYLRWAFDAWNENPLLDISYKFWESGDILLIYPSDIENLYTPLSSPRFEMLKKGYRYVEKAKYLMHCVSDKKLDIFNIFKDIKRPISSVNKHGGMYAKNIHESDILIKSVDTIIQNFNDLTKKILSRRKDINYRVDDEVINFKQIDAEIDIIVKEPIHIKIAKFILSAYYSIINLFR